MVPPGQGKGTDMGQVCAGPGTAFPLWFLAAWSRAADPCSSRAVRAAHQPDPASPSRLWAEDALQHPRPQGFCLYRGLGAGSTQPKKEASPGLVSSGTLGKRWVRLQPQITFRPPTSVMQSWGEEGDD